MSQDLVINFVSDNAFHAANTCRAATDFQAVFRYLAVYPDGRVIGTDGFRASRHKSGVEPFTLEGDVPNKAHVAIKPASKVALSATKLRLEVTLDPSSERDFTGLLHYTQGKTEKVVTCDVRVGGVGRHQMPDVERVIAARSTNTNRDVIALNMKYAYELSQAVDNPAMSDKNHTAWQLVRQGDTTHFYLATGNADHIVLLVGLTENKLGDMPLPRGYEADS